MGEKQLRPEDPPRFQSDSCASAIARSSLPHTILVDHLGCVAPSFWKTQPRLSGLHCSFLLGNAAQASAMIVRLLPADDVAFQALEGGVECRRHARALREGR